MAQRKHKPTHVRVSAPCVRACFYIFRLATPNGTVILFVHKVSSLRIQKKNSLGIYTAHASFEWTLEYILRALVQSRPALSDSLRIPV